MFYTVYASGNNYHEDYRLGVLSRDEKRALDIISEYPEISSRDLRKKYAPPGKDSTRNLNRALQSLQETFRITVAGGSLDGWTLHNWALVDEHLAQTWIEKNDGPFKILLDQYKYPNRYPDCDQEKILGEAIELMLKPMEAALQSSRYLLGEKMTWVDVAIFPFIRQFAMVNSRRFEVLPFSLTKKWLNQFMECELFHSVMHQYPTWVD